MISKELKKLSRRELIDIIYQMKKNEQQMQEEIASLQDALQEKRIKISAAGSIAEAAASITDIFAAAQATADLYLQEISCLKAETEKERSKSTEAATRAAEKIIDDAHKTAEKILADCEKEYIEMRIRYHSECRKLEQLREEAEALEDLKKRG